MKQLIIGNIGNRKCFVFQFANSFSFASKHLLIFLMTVQFCAAYFGPTGKDIPIQNIPCRSEHQFFSSVRSPRLFDRACNRHFPTDASVSAHTWDWPGHPVMPFLYLCGSSSLYCPVAAEVYSFLVLVHSSSTLRSINLHKCFTIE